MKRIHKIPLTFFIVGSIWILLSDNLEPLLLNISPFQVQYFQKVKGIFFILISTGILFFLIKSYESKILEEEILYRSSRKHIHEGYILYETDKSQVFEYNPTAAKILGINIGSEKTEMGLQHLIQLKKINQTIINEIEYQILLYGKYKFQNIEFIDHKGNVKLINLTGEKIRSLNKSNLIELIFEDVTELISKDKLSKFALELYSIESKINSEHDFIQKGLDLTEGMAESNLAFLLSINESDNSFEVLELSTKAKSIVNFSEKNKVFQIASNGGLDNCLKTQKPFINNNLKSNKLVKNELHSYFPFTKSIAIPIIENNKVVAIVEIANKDVDYGALDAMQIQAFVAVFWTMLKKKHSDLQLNYQRKLLQEAESIAKLGSWEYNHLNETLYWSEEIYKIFEIDEFVEPNEEVFNSRILDEDKVKVKQAFFGMVENQKQYFLIHPLQMPDGKIKFVEERGKTEYSADGKPIKTIGTCLDITNKQLLINQLESQNKQLSEIAQIQSHEYRAPVARILGLIESFDSIKDKISEEAMREVIYKSAQEIDNIIKKINEKTNN